MKKAPVITGEKTAGKVQLTPVRILKLIVSVILVVLAVIFTVKAVVNTNKVPDTFYCMAEGDAKFNVIGLSLPDGEEAESDGGSFEEEVDEAFEEAKTVKIFYMFDGSDYESCYMGVTYTEEEWEAAKEEGTYATVENCWIYSDVSRDSGEHATYIGFNHEPTTKELAAEIRGNHAIEEKGNYGAGMAIFFAAISFIIMFFWHEFFTRYEQIWFISIIVLASIVSILVPEEDVNGINGLVIMLLYLLDTFLNILCELLISKQSKWNFIVSIFVEITEITICLVLSYRFATLASTLFFWLPCDIISFINWHKHPDKVEEELTEVRTLKGWQEVAILAGIAVWTIVVGWFLSGLEFTTTLFNGNDTLATVVCYIDACASAVGVVNGVFILVRLREQWIAWYACALLEAVINILSGQWVLLVLKLGYFTNTTYGYIKWTKYIKGLNGKNGKQDNSHKKLPKKA